MIALTSIAELIENTLNSLGDKTFRIYADMGDFQKSYKAYNSNQVTHYINGVLESLAPSVLPIKNLQAMTQTFRLSVVADVALLNKDDNGNYIEVEQIRQILQDYITQSNGVPFALADGSITFELTPSFSGVIVGTASQLSPIGQVLPIYLDFSYSIIERGINTNNVSFLVNGENIYFDTYSTTRKRECDVNMFPNDNYAKGLAQSNALSFTFKAPLLNATVSQQLEDDVYSGIQNTAYCVVRIRGEKQNAYIMIIGENTESGEMSKNIGQTISFIEGKREEVILDSNYWETIVGTSPLTPPSYQEITLHSGDTLFLPSGRTFTNIQSIDYISNYKIYTGTTALVFRKAGVQ